MTVPGASVPRDAGESDWDDQDLLTLEEAGHRLQEEIHLAEERLAQARREPGATPAALDALQRRLDALVSAQQRNDGGASPLART